MAVGCVAERADEVRALQRGPLLPARLLSPAGAERLGIVPDEIAGGHCVALSRSKEVADMLAGYAATASATTNSRIGIERIR